MSKLIERYTTAIGASDLRSRSETTHSAIDVVGAFGMASKTNGLAVALTRLVMAGDNRALDEVVAVLSPLARKHAGVRGLRQVLGRGEAEEMVKKVVAWFQHGACTACGGLGFQRIAGTPALSDAACPSCSGKGRVPFEAQFRHQHRETALWLLVKIEREIARAGPAARAALGPSGG